MENIRIFRSPILSLACCSNRVRTNADIVRGEDIDADELNVTGVFNHSRTHIVKTSLLVEPSGWYSSREYFVVTKGSDVGVFHKLAEVHRSIDSIASAKWETCKTWKQAVELWDSACRSGTVSLLREGVWDTPTSQEPSPSTPALKSHPKARSTARNLVSGAPLTQSLAPGTSTPSVSVPKKFPKVIVISDSESNDDSIEVTSPKKVVKINNCFEYSEEEDGTGYLRKTFDAATNTYLNTPIKAGKASNTSSLGRLQPASTSAAPKSGHKTRGRVTFVESTESRAKSSSTSSRPTKGVKSAIKVVRTT